MIINKEQAVSILRQSLITHIMLSRSGAFHSSIAAGVQQYCDAVSEAIELFERQPAGDGKANLGAILEIPLDNVNPQSVCQLLANLSDQIWNAHDRYHARTLTVRWTAYSENGHK